MRKKMTKSPRNHGISALLTIAVLLSVCLAGCGGPESAVSSPTPKDAAKSAVEAPDTPEVASAETIPPAEAMDASKEEASSSLPPVTEIDATMLGEILAATEGKVTVVNFWATWCGPCVHEMPDLVKFYNDTDREKLAFVSVSVDAVPEISGAIPEFQQKYDVPFPIHVLAGRDDAALMKAIKTEFDGSIPATYIYGEDGALAATVVGAVTIAELQEMVEKLK